MIGELTTYERAKQKANRELNQKLDYGMLLVCSLFWGLIVGEMMIRLTN